MLLGEGERFILHGRRKGFRKQWSQERGGTSGERFIFHGRRTGFRSDLKRWVVLSEGERFILHEKGKASEEVVLKEGQYFGRVRD